jgi:hypothetical protein
MIKMSESFRERIKRNIQLMNQLTDYEKQHELEWCPISDEMLKEMYPGQCETQEDGDKKVDSMTSEEIRALLDATLKRYRMLKRKKQIEQGQSSSDQQTEEKESQQQEEEEKITAQ